MSGVVPNARGGPRIAGRVASYFATLNLPLPTVSSRKGPRPRNHSGGLISRVVSNVGKLFPANGGASVSGSSGAIVHGRFAFVGRVLGDRNVRRGSNGVLLAMRGLRTVGSTIGATGRTGTGTRGSLTITGATGRATRGDLATIIGSLSDLDSDVGGTTSGGTGMRIVHSVITGVPKANASDRQRTGRSGGFTSVTASPVGDFRGRWRWAVLL